MRAVIAVPPVQDFYFTPHRASALGGRAVQRVLESRGWETTLLHFPVSQGGGKVIPLPEALNHLSPFILSGERGPTSFFRHYYRFGPETSEACRTVLAHAPDLILVSCFAWAYAEEARELIGCLKITAPEIPVILGGSGAAVLPEYFFPPASEKPGPDYLLGGEAETQLADLLSAAGRKPPPVKTNKGVLLPFDPTVCAASLPVLWGVSRAGGVPQINLHLSRGCAMGCRFCSNHLTQGRVFRKADLSALGQTLEEIERVFGVLLKGKILVNLEDDNLLQQPDYFLEVLSLLRERIPGAVFTAENGLDHRLLSPELAETLIDLGFQQFNLSLAQINPRLLQQEKRTFHREQYENLLRLAASRKIGTITYFIAGLPGDNGENLINNLLYLSGLPTNIGISLFYPVPGLPGFTDKTIFLRHSPRLTAGSSAWPWGSSLSTREMVTAFRLSRMINFLKRSPREPREEDMRRQLLENRRLLTWYKGNPTGEAPPGIDEALVSGLWERLGSFFRP